MKFKVGNEVKSKLSGKMGKVEGTDYSYHVRNREITETIKYLVKWEDKVMGAWVNEDGIESAGQAYIAKLETDHDLLLMQIDEALKNGNKEDFNTYSSRLREVSTAIKLSKRG